MRMAGAAAAALFASLLLTGTALAAPACQNRGNFEHWLGEFKREAAAQGIPSHIISAGLGEVTLDPGVIRRDRGQGVFAQSFLQFSDRMVSKYRLVKGAQLIKQHAALFARIEKQFGVPAPVIVAFWGLESDFGSNNGKFKIGRAHV